MGELLPFRRYPAVPVAPYGLAVWFGADDRVLLVDVPSPALDATALLRARRAGARAAVGPGGLPHPARLALARAGRARLQGRRLRARAARLRAAGARAVHGLARRGTGAVGGCALTPRATRVVLGRPVRPSTSSGSSGWRPRSPSAPRVLAAHGAPLVGAAADRRDRGRDVPRARARRQGGDRPRDADLLPPRDPRAGGVRARAERGRAAGVAAGLDAAVLGIGAFLAFGRIGCLNAGCCHGRPARAWRALRARARRRRLPARARRRAAGAGAGGRGGGRRGDHRSPGWRAWRPARSPASRWSSTSPPTAWCGSRWRRCAATRGGATARLQRGAVDLAGADRARGDRVPVGGGRTGRDRARDGRVGPSRPRRRRRPRRRARPCAGALGGRRLAAATRGRPAVVGG